MSQPPERLWAALPGWARRVLTGAALVYIGVVAVGIVSVALGDPTPTTPALSPATTSDPDLALVARGARARVSSFHPSGQHHPVFLIDGQRRPATTLEKWTSDLRDRTPWLEILLPTPVDFTVVEVVHAGIMESDAYTLGDYDLTCFAGERPLASLEVRGHRLDVARHPLACPGADRLRAQFHPGPAQGPRGVARIYEVRLLGGTP